MSLSRRTFLAGASAFATSHAMPVFGKDKSIEATVQYSDIQATDAWIRGWMGDAFAAASGSLHLGRFADPMYFLTQQINWEPNSDQEGKSVSVPIGFVTDFASVPRVFWTALPRDGQYTYPAIIHDYLYWEQPVSRKDADYVLDCAMGDFNVPAVTRGAIYAAVRVGGGIAWKENAGRKAAGESRILKKFPIDPTTTWEKWRKSPDVF